MMRYRKSSINPPSQISPPFHGKKVNKGRYTLGDKLQQHVAATRCSDKSLRVYWRIFVKIFVAATEFCRHNKSHRFSLIWFFATCCRDKILSRRLRFSQKFSSTHEAICHCDVSSHLVAANSHPTCTHGVICRRDVLLQLVSWCVPTLSPLSIKPRLHSPNYSSVINDKLYDFHTIMSDRKFFVSTVFHSLPEPFSVRYDFLRRKHK